MRGKAFLVVAIGVIGLAGCSIWGGDGPQTRESSGELFSMVVTMAGKELTLDAPRLSPGHEGYGTITVVVKNSGRALITMAEIEVAYWEQYYIGEEESGIVRVKNLSPGEVQTIAWEPPAEIRVVSLRVRVIKIE